MTAGDTHLHRPDGSCRSVRPGSVRVPRRDGAVGGASSRHSRRFLARSGGVLVGATGGGIHARHGPVDAACRVGVGLDGPQDLVPRAVRRPASVSFVYGLPLAETCRQIPPGHSGPLPEEDPVDHPAVALPTPAPLARFGQTWLQPGPLVVRQISPSRDGRNDPGPNQSHDPPDRPSSRARPPRPLRAWRAAAG